MKLRAIHRKRGSDGKVEEETVVIIAIFQPHHELAPQAVFVRGDGAVGDDIIYSFVITDGAWEPMRSV